jgi:hypothetical protein
MPMLLIKQVKGNDLFWSGPGNKSMSNFSKVRSQNHSYIECQILSVVWEYHFTQMYSLGMVRYIILSPFFLFFFFFFTKSICLNQMHTLKVI